MKAAEMKKYDLDFTPTDGMASEAQRALDWRKEGNRGGTSVGIARARQLVNKQNLSPSTVRRMFSFFSRHEVDKEAQGFRPGEEGYPSPGRVAWGLWGGDAGFTWSKAKVAQMNRIDEKDISASVKGTLQEKVKEHNKKYKGKGKRVTYNMLAKVFKRGVGAYHTNPQSVRPSVTSPEQWAFARVNSFLYAVINGNYRSGKHDTDLLPKGHPMRGEKMIGVFNTTIKKVSEDDDYIVIRGMASTKDIDRAGDIMDPSCWEKGGLANYMNNPIILFNHDYNRPIGRGTDVKVTKNGLELTAKISKADRYISKLIQDGVLSTFSVGFKVREADHMKETGGLYIKDAELYEISVVSIPANQAATFEVVKCFSPSEFELYKSGLITPKGEDEINISERKINMNEEELKALIAKQTSAAVKMALAEKEVADKKAVEEKAAKEAEVAKLEQYKSEAVAVAKSGTEKLLEEVKATFEASREATLGEIEGLKAALKDRAEEVKALQNSKRQFVANGTNDWKKAHEGEIRDAFLLGKITEKGWNSKFGTEVINKVSNFSGVEIPGAASIAIFETIASTSIERDIQNELILAPLFREIPMTSMAMVLPILPDAGYAEFISTKNVTNTGGDAPHGNLDERSDTAGSPYEGVDLGSKTLTTKKLVSLTFLANETEEDSILPILPLLTESMVRAHARAVERAMLRGSSSIGSFDGLTTLATTNSDVVANTTAFASDALTSDHLLGMRKAMGKYGVRPGEVVYIVSERAYFELLEDPEFKDVSLVGANSATKVKGEIGNVYGSRVVLCDEFVTPAVNQFFAVAVNSRNFVVPRLRGVTLESQYVPRLQHRELIATQRLGFEEVITGATAAVGRKYHSA
jgi:HK97 family phage prohead protease/HK97 family phage major capsid protein